MNKTYRKLNLGLAVNTKPNTSLSWSEFRGSKARKRVKIKKERKHEKMKSLYPRRSHPPAAQQEPRNTHAQAQHRYVLRRRSRREKKSRNSHEKDVGPTAIPAPASEGDSQMTTTM